MREDERVVTRKQAIEAILDQIERGYVPEPEPQRYPVYDNNSWRWDVVWVLVIAGLYAVLVVEVLK